MVFNTLEASPCCGERCSVAFAVLTCFVGCEIACFVARSIVLQEHSHATVKVGSGRLRRVVVVIIAAGVVTGCRVVTVGCVVVTRAAVVVTVGLVLAVVASVVVFVVVVVAVALAVLVGTVGRDLGIWSSWCSTRGFLCSPLAIRSEHAAHVDDALGVLLDELGRQVRAHDCQHLPHFRICHEPLLLLGLLLCCLGPGGAEAEHLRSTMGEGGGTQARRLGVSIIVEPAGSKQDGRECMHGACKHELLL